MNPIILIYSTFVCGATKILISEFNKNIENNILISNSEIAKTCNVLYNKYKDVIDEAYKCSPYSQNYFEKLCEETVDRLNNDSEICSGWEFGCRKHQQGFIYKNNWKKSDRPKPGPKDPLCLYYEFLHIKETKKGFETNLKFNVVGIDDERVDFCEGLISEIDIDNDGNLEKKLISRPLKTFKKKVETKKDAIINNKPDEKIQNIQVVKSENGVSIEGSVDKMVEMIKDSYAVYDKIWHKINPKSALNSKTDENDKNKNKTEFEKPVNELYEKLYFNHRKAIDKIKEISNIK